LPGKRRWINPAMMAQTGTHCVHTRIECGHALNALPQRAVGHVNCRIFPGHSKASIIEELKAVAAEPSVEITEINPEYVVEAGASPYDKTFVDAATKAVHAAFGPVPIRNSRDEVVGTVTSC